MVESRISPDAVLRVQGLSVTFAGASRPALDFIDLELNAGRAIALLGPSGAGKTTFGLALAGVLDERRVDIEGSIEPRGPNVVAYIPQEPRHAFCPFVPVFAQVSRVAAASGGAQPDKMATSALEKSGLDPRRARRLPAELSTGECQRAAIAVARLSPASVLVLDEPLARLDAPLRTQLAPMLRALAKEERRALVLLTHDPYVVKAVADDVLHLHQGRLHPGIPADWD